MTKLNFDAQPEKGAQVTQRELILKKLSEWEGENNSKYKFQVCNEYRKMIEKLNDDELLFIDDYLINKIDIERLSILEETHKIIEIISENQKRLEVLRDRYNDLINLKGRTVKYLAFNISQLDNYEIPFANCSCVTIFKNFLSKLLEKIFIMREKKINIEETINEFILEIKMLGLEITWLKDFLIILNENITMIDEIYKIINDPEYQVNDLENKNIPPSIMTFSKIWDYYCMLNAN